MAPTKLISTSVGFQDAKGNVVALGLLSLTLSQNAEVTSGGGQVTTEPLYFALDASGKITSTAIYFNDELTPSGTVYKAILYASNGMRIIQDFGYWSITGASADLSTMVPTSIGGASAAGVVITAPTANQAISQPTGTQLTVNRFNNHVYVDGVKYPLTQAGVQSAITDACAISGGAGAGVHVWLPPCSISLSNTSGQQFLVTAPIQFHGSGPNSSWFVIANTVPNTVPCFRVKPATSDIGWYSFENMRIVGNGTFGGDAFFLDATNAGVNHFTLRACDIVSLDNSAWALNMNTVGGVDRFFLGHIVDCNLSHGIQLNSTSTADSWLIEHNTFGCFAGNSITTPCINATTEAGSSHITMFNNNGGLPGGFFISHGTTEPQIIYNQIEHPVGFASTEANSAIIDLIGDSYAIDHANIIGNNIGSNGQPTNCIRVGNATNTMIANNVIGVKTVTGVGVLITGSASGTRINADTNEFLGVSGGAVAVSNSGINPFIKSFPTASGTLPASIVNDTVGGLLVIPNAGQIFQWQFLNTGPLQSPKGAGILLQGGSTGTTQVLASTTAAGTITVPAQTGTLNATVASVDLTAQTAAQGTTTLFAVPSTGAGQYLFSWNSKITTAAGTSSTLGPMTLIYTDPDGVTITTVVSGTQAGGGITVSGLTTTATSTFLIGTPLLINAKASTNIQFSFGYASNPAAAMNYNLHIKLEAM